MNVGYVVDGSLMIVLPMLPAALHHALPAPDFGRALGSQRPAPGAWELSKLLLQRWW
jgi:hypothetical protein